MKSQHYWVNCSFRRQMASYTHCQVIRLRVAVHSLMSRLHCVSEKRVMFDKLYSFVKHGLILIILDKQHQHAFQNYKHIQCFPCLVTFAYSICFLINCDGNDANYSAFSSVDYWWLWREPVSLKRAGFILAVVQSDVFSPACMDITAFQLINGFVQDSLWYSSSCQWGAASSRRCRVISVTAI